MRSLDGSESFDWETDLRIQDSAVTPDGRKLIVLSVYTHITVFDIPSKSEDYTIKSLHRMTCLSVSRDSKHMLVNMANDEVHLINIETADIVRKFTGQHQDIYIIRSTFGGTDQGLVLSGSCGRLISAAHFHTTRTLLIFLSEQTRRSIFGTSTMAP